MSCPASALTVELPRWPLADRVSLLLALASGATIEAVLARYPQAPLGVGVAVTALLAAALWYARRRRPLVLELAPGGGSMRLRDGTRAPFRPGIGSRVLGSSVVLHWRSAGRSGSLWLTPADQPRETLRALAVRLVAAGHRAGQ